MYKYVYSKELPMKLMRNGQPVDLGSVWISESTTDTKKLKAMNVPYISFRGNKEDLTKLIVLPFLKRLFPKLKWKDIVPDQRKKNPVIHVPGGMNENREYVCNAYGGTMVSDRADDPRYFNDCTNTTEGMFHEFNINDWIGTSEFVVDVMRLQQLEMLPKFLSDIVSATYTRGEDLHWEEGYNKKLGICSGNFTDIQGSKNLLIIDVSASIPTAVSSTMLALADNLRQQMSADLIITGGKSYFWAAGEELPSPQKIRDMVPRSNEDIMFKRIMKEHVFGNTYDNVIAFGDNDRPYWYDPKINIPPTRIGKLYSFRVWDDYDEKVHPNQKSEPVGYANWVKYACPECDYEYDIDWVKVCL